MTSSDSSSNGDLATVGTATARFDVREFARTARGSHRDTLDLDAIAASGLEPDAARLVRALRDLERLTHERMRNLLVTATHKDARMTAFLTTWAYEKFWIADALDAVLEASGAELDLPADEGRRRHSPHEATESWGPIRRAFVSNFAGPDIIGSHVTTGLVDEWITQAAYRRMAEAAAAITSVAELVLSIKDRHIAFLSEEAHRRLSSSRRVQRLARRDLKRAAWPIGSIDRPAEERSFFERFVFGADAGRERADKIGALIAALPGMGTPIAATVEARLIP